MALVVAGCSGGVVEVPVVGEAPVECEAMPVGGNDDVEPGSEPLATLIAKLPVGDPDCTAPATIVERTAAFLTWSEAGAQHDELVAAEQRSTWARAGDACRARIAITYQGGPAGRMGTVRPCDASMLSAAWASFADVPVIVESVAIDGESAAAAWPAAWTDGTDPASAATCAPAATIERPALGLEVAVEVDVAIADWRRLQSTTPPVLAIRAAITVP